MANTSEDISLNFRSDADSIEKAQTDKQSPLKTTNEVLIRQMFPALGIWKQPSSQHGPLYIRTRESTSKVDLGAQYIGSSLPTTSAQGPPKHVIDLTEDDDDEEIAPARKKSRSSSDSSQKSDKVIKTTRAATDPDPSIGYSKRQAISPPAYPFLSHPTGRRASHSPSPKLAAEGVRRRPSQQQPLYPTTSPATSARSLPPKVSDPAPPLQPSKPASFGKASVQFLRPHTPRQYASAVVVQPRYQRSEPTPEEIRERHTFMQNLSQVPNVTLTNTIDNTSPPTSFQFISTSVLTPGVTRAPDDVMVGCSCRRKRGINECKYPNECSCLKDSGGYSVIKRSQYSGAKRGCLVKQVLSNRFNIYECNRRCDCSDYCQNRVVQWGRKISLEIFKTGDGRGWGLRCGQDLQEGQFVDTYRGEIITTGEADKRKKGANEDNYLFDFDKFEDAKYVCDGKHMGGPTRFINHSCRPNCALFTVTYNHYDSYLYELAFFAMGFIPKGTELTFDYLDRDDLEGERKITEADAQKMEREKGYAPSVCRCGAEDCRGYFFFSKD